MIPPPLLLPTLRPLSNCRVTLLIRSDVGKADNLAIYYWGHLGEEVQVLEFHAKKGYRKGRGDRGREGERALSIRLGGL